MAATMPAMEKAARSLPEGYDEIGVLDFHKDKRNIYTSYVLRFAGIIVFMPLFAFVAAAVRPRWDFDPVDFWTLSIPGVPAVGSIALLIVSIVGVLYLHELVHAAVFRLSGADSTRIGFRGVMVFAAAEGWYFPRSWMALNAVAPFFVISIAGTFFMAVVSEAALSWVFLPMVINASASGGDFMTLAWLVLAPKDSLFGDIGDVLRAYGPVQPRASE